MEHLITWNEAGTRVFETGLDRGVLFVAKDGKYPEGVAWNGLTAINDSPTGAEPTAEYADNIKYAEIYSTEEFGATIEAFTYPSEFEECDGSKQVAPGITIGQQNRGSFGLAYRTLIGNDIEGQMYGYKLHLVYGAKVSPSEKAYGTINDTPELLTFSWDLTTTAVANKYGQPTATIVIDSTKVDAGKLSALEAILYGKPGTAPEDAVKARLPLPDEVFTILEVTGE